MKPLSSRLETLPPEPATTRATPARQSVRAGPRDALAALEVWRETSCAAALFWRARAWRMRPRKLFVPGVDSPTSALLALVEMGCGLGRWSRRMSARSGGARLGKRVTTRRECSCRSI